MAAAPRKCLWCQANLPSSSVSVLTHGDSIVRCASCGTVYTATLLLTIPAQTWMQMLNRTGWEVTQQEGTNYLVLTAQ